MGFGGSSLSHCAPPFPGPLPTAATTTTSSSTLSPLATPFTVDRAAARPALPYEPCISPWPLPPQSSDDFLRHHHPHHHRPPSPSPPPGSPPRPSHGADPLPYYAHGRTLAVPDFVRAAPGEASSRRSPSIAQADPYYARFSSAAASSGGDAPVFYGGCREGSASRSGYLGRHAALSNAPFGVGTPAEGVGRGSSWMEHENVAISSGFGLGFQQDASIAPGFIAYEDLHSGWHEKLTEPPSGKDQFVREHLDWFDVGNTSGVPSDLSVTSALAPSTSVGVCYAHSSEIHTSVERSKPTDFNSSYDRYAYQANTDTTDPGVFYPATTYFPAKILPSSGSTSASMDKCSLKSVNHVQDVSAYKNDTLHRGRVSIRPEEPHIDLTFGHKKDDAGINKEEAVRKNDNPSMNSSVMKITSPPSIESAKQIPQDYSLGKKSELRMAYLNIPGLVEFDREQSSSERLDEILAEDSPCWKGAPSSRHSVSNTFDTLVADCASAGQKFDGCHKRGTDNPKIENVDVALHPGGVGNCRNKVTSSKDHRDDFESKNEDVVPAANEEKGSMPAKDKFTATANHCTDPTEVNSFGFCSLANNQLSFASKTLTDAPDGRIRPPAISDHSFRCSTLAIDPQVLVKAIHNLSELLLSSYLFDAKLLKEYDQELLRAVVNNLNICILRKSESGIMLSEMFSSDSYYHRQLSALPEDVPKGRGRCLATGSVSIDGNVEQSNNRNAYPDQEKMHSNSSNVVSDKLGNFLSISDDKNHEKLSGRVVNENIYGQGDSTQSAFETLWFDVEDAIHLLKYRLQLLRSNIVMDNSEQQLIKDAEKEASNMLALSNQNCRSGIIGESMPLWISAESLSNTSAQGKHEIVNNFQKTQQTISSSSDSKAGDVDASVMARFKVLKRRIDNIDSVDAEEQHGWVNSVNAVSNSGTHENICGPSPSVGKPNLGTKLQPANDAMPAGWGYQRLFHRGATECEVGGRSSVQRVADCIEDRCLNSHFSEHRMSEGFCAQGAGGLANQSYVPDGRSGKHFGTGVRDGSSDWEHVLEEELTW